MANNFSVEDLNKKIESLYGFITKKREDVLKILADIEKLCKEMLVLQMQLQDKQDNGQNKGQ